MPSLSRLLRWRWLLLGPVAGLLITLAAVFLPDGRPSRLPFRLAFARSGLDSWFGLPIRITGPAELLIVNVDGHRDGRLNLTSIGSVPSRLIESCDRAGQGAWALFEVRAPLAFVWKARPLDVQWEGSEAPAWARSVEQALSDHVVALARERTGDRSANPGRAAARYQDAVDAANQLLIGVRVPEAPATAVGRWKEFNGAVRSGGLVPVGLIANVLLWTSLVWLLAGAWRFMGRARSAVGSS
ncbi:MAG: hypothetical protein IT436_18435 [Phycisphaerales bacterium]|nr:hypothetical protein [Phycisphaerales bacterium]